MPSLGPLTGLIALLAGCPTDKERWAALEAALAGALTPERVELYNITLGGLRALKAAVADLPAGFRFWDTVLPCLLHAANDAPRLFPGGAGLPTPLRRGTNAAVELSESQVACLVAHAFLGTLEPLPLPRARSAMVRAFGGEFITPHFGDPSWWRVLQSGSPVAAERLKCFLAYWQARAAAAAAPAAAAGSAGPERVIRFERVCLGAVGGAALPDWAASSAPLAAAAPSLGRCEDVRGAAAVVDFANKDLHIASIIPSCTQEECLFNVYPELFAALAFCETMADDEALAVSGLRRAADYTGYLGSFRFMPLMPGAPAAAIAAAAAAEGGGETVLAVDALVVESPEAEGSEGSLRRELGKFAAGLEALRRLRAAAAARSAAGGAAASPAPAIAAPAESAMSEDPVAPAAPPAPLLVATGNWGCGVFGGDRCVKFLQQLLAASAASVPASAAAAAGSCGAPPAAAAAALAPFALDFACVRDEAWARSLATMLRLLGSLDYSAGDLWHLLRAYGADVAAGHARFQPPNGTGAFIWVMQNAERVQTESRRRAVTAAA